MEDAELVAGLLARREEAVAAYSERYRSLFHHCIGQFESDPSAREDLYQDLLWYALERLSQGSYNPEKGSFGTWLYRVAWCRCVDRKRQLGARRQLPIQQLNAEEAARDQRDPRSGPGEQVSRDEIGRLVRAALVKLDPEDRALLELRIIEGQILPAIAAELSITIEQVKYRLKRASQNLRRIFAAHCWNTCHARSPWNERHPSRKQRLSAALPSESRAVMQPTSMDPAARADGPADCDRPDLASRLHDGEDLSGSFGKEIELHSRNCAACSLRLSLVRQAESWLADQGSSNRSAVRSSSPCPSAEELFDFGHGPGAIELPAAHTRRIEAHLVECAPCRGLVATLATRPPVPLLDRAKLRPLDATPPPATTAPAPRLALHDAPRRTAARRQPWLAYAAAAAVMAGAVYVWRTRGAPLGAERSEIALLTRDAASVFPNLPVLRGDTSLALRFPAGRVLAATPNSIQAAGAGTWHALHFEITPQVEAQSYRIELSRAAESAFGKRQVLARHGSPQSSFELPAGLVQPLAPGEYAWEAWALVNGLEQPLGTRSFEVVDDASARDQLRICNALAEPARSKSALGWLVAHEFFSDARAWARALPQSPERDAFLAGFPGR